MRHGQVKEYFRLGGKFVRALLQQIQCPGVLAAFVKNPPECIRQERIIRAQISGSSRDLKSFVELVETLRVQISEIVQGRTEVAIYAEKLFISLPCGSEVLALIVDQRDLHKRGDIIRVLGDELFQPLQCLPVFVRSDVRLRQREVGGAEVGIQLDGLQQCRFRLTRLVLRQEDFRDQEL